MGKGPLFLMRSSSSVPSSMIVRSAPKLVSNTYWNPRAFAQATIFPVVISPGSRPKFSPKATRVAGAVCSTITLPAFMAAFTRGMWLCSVMAPVGQTTLHWPQLMHSVSFSRWWPVGTTGKPPSSGLFSRMFMPCSSVQARAQRLQSMHRLMSRWRA